MAFTRLPFPSYPWAAGAHPLEKKKVAAPGSPVTLLEFAPGFVDPNVCTSGHVVYVVEGRMSFELDGGLIELEAGEACVIDPGTRHRAKNAGDGKVVLFVVAR